MSLALLIRLGPEPELNEDKTFRTYLIIVRISTG